MKADDDIANKPAVVLPREDVVKVSPVHGAIRNTLTRAPYAHVGEGEKRVGQADIRKLYQRGVVTIAVGSGVPAVRPHCTLYPSAPVCTAVLGVHENKTGGVYCRLDSQQCPTQSRTCLFISLLDFDVFVGA